MPSAPSRKLEAVPNPKPGREYEVRCESPEFTCLSHPAHGPASTSPPCPDHVRARTLDRRAQVAQALPVEIPRRGRLPRGRHQPDPRRPRGRRRWPQATHESCAPTGWCVGGSTPWSRSPSRDHRAVSAVRNGGTGSGDALPGGYIWPPVSPTPPTRRYWVETLGCPKNQVDSDKLIGTLESDGMVPGRVGAR